ncbi:MAG: dihydroxyacetone kinase subunit DhaK, partial [Microbacterium sp.]
MTVIANDPAAFADEAIRGFADAFGDVVMQVPGGVVRATTTPRGKVAVVVGGGSGHYPAFAGLVGHGFADGAVVGNVFTSPSAADVESVVRHAVSDEGAVVLTGNYAGDVMNFTLATQALAADGIDARYLVVTDDLASAPPEDQHLRRG